MAIHFIDNYPKNLLETKICKSDGTPQHGEIWVYQELLKFETNNFLVDQQWYVKHCYNLSSHPSSMGKVEGEIDYLIISKFGILLLEVKGGGVEVDENDIYYSSTKDGRKYTAQNPFVQVREYLNSLKRLLSSTPFIYRAVIFPHERSFRLEGPQLSGYKHLFFSLRDLEEKNSDFGKNELFFFFLKDLAKEARRKIVQKENPNLASSQVEAKIWKRFPELTKHDISRLRSELFPIQTTYGFDPDRVKKELLLDENFEVLKGLRKNRKVMVEGGPGTGKTVLATKFLAEHLMKQHKGIYFCSNLLLRARMEHIILNEYKLDPNLISFRILVQKPNISNVPTDLDFVIVDEAQEFFDSGLCDFIDSINIELSYPRLLILYDIDQSILTEGIELGWYADYLIEQGFSHFFFDKVWRCAQHTKISEFSTLTRQGQYKKLEKEFRNIIQKVASEIEKIAAINSILKANQDRFSSCIILVDSTLIGQFRSITTDYFSSDIQELTDKNINIKSSKLRFTSPLKYKGLEQDHVILVTPQLSNSTKVQNYVAATRAIYELSVLIWTI